MIVKGRVFVIERGDSTGVYKRLIHEIRQLLSRDKWWFTITAAAAGGMEAPIVSKLMGAKATLVKDIFKLGTPHLRARDVRRKRGPWMDVRFNKIEFKEDKDQFGFRKGPVTQRDFLHSVELKSGDSPVWMLFNQTVTHGKMEVEVDADYHIRIGGLEKALCAAITRKGQRCKRVTSTKWCAQHRPNEVRL